MKSIILNLLKQSYDFFAVALTTGFIFSFFFPIKHFLLFTIGVVIADTITGIKAAKKEGKAIKRINYYNNLHLQISGKPVYTSTALRDTTAFIGDWTLVFNGENILGEIQINNANRFIFNPDNGKVYSISTNLLLSTFTNQITFSFNGVKYDLYKFANGKFSTIDGDVKLIKKE